MTLLAEPPPWVRPAPAPQPVPVRAVSAVSVLAALTGCWLWAGLHPDVEPGQGLDLDGVRVTTDEFDRVAFTAPPTGGRLVVGVRNDGLLPVTLTTVRTDLSQDALVVEGYRDGAGVQEAVTLTAGEEAQVVLRVGVLPPYCSAVTPGTVYTALEVPLRVRSLGLASTQPLPLPLPVQVTAASPACR